jgi:hypothetical protein
MKSHSYKIKQWFSQSEKRTLGMALSFLIDEDIPLMALWFFFLKKNKKYSFIFFDLVIEQAFTCEVFSQIIYYLLCFALIIVLI